MTRPIIVAHRGLHRALPENSIAAFELAAREGIEWVECDVHASADGTPYILHDETLERTTTGHGAIASSSDQQLGSVRLKDRSGARLPTLHDALAVLAGRARWLVEIKPRDAKSLVAEVLSVFQRWPGLCTVQSFDPRNLFHAWSLNPEMPGALLVGDEVGLQAVNERSWPAVHIDHQALSPSLLATLRSRGTRVGVWTVNEPADIERVLQLGVDVIITDEPMRVCEML